MPKNIVVFSDGTNQDGGKGNPSNVYKLFNMVEDRTTKQIAFYDPGVGIGWRRFTGNVAGMGIAKNIKDCYRFIFENFLAGDKIYLIGFSRGATTVRSLAGFIDLFQILPLSRPKLINQAYRIYKISNKKKRARKAAIFLAKHHTMKSKIKALAVWDTVSALGFTTRLFNKLFGRLPFFKCLYHDLKLPKAVQHCYQALALDEKRAKFSPLLWQKTKKSAQIIKQVWFCGSHTDIGGGYSSSALSDIPLCWLKSLLVEQGLLIYENNKVEVVPDVNGRLHDSYRGFWRLLGKKVRSCDKRLYGRPVVHETVLKRKSDIAGGKYKSWILETKYEVFK